MPPFVFIVLKAVTFKDNFRYSNSQRVHSADTDIYSTPQDAIMGTNIHNTLQH